MTTTQSTLENRIESRLVDLEARKSASQLFRAFISGKITNFAFEENQPITVDPAIPAIWNTSWLLYDDFEEHKLLQHRKLAMDVRRVCLRWLIFLHTDNPYDWPEIPLPGSDPTLRIQSRSLWDHLRGKTGVLERESVEKFLATGNYAVWPFISQKSYRQALRQPKFMRGS